MAGNVTSNPSPEISIAKRAASMRFRKKKSVASVSVRKNKNKKLKNIKKYGIIKFLPNEFRDKT